MTTQAEQNRDRIFARIDKIMNQPYKAPENIRLELYAFMVEEFTKCEEHARARK